MTERQRMLSENENNSDNGSIVIVNIYDIPSPRFNKFMSATGLSGIYHSAVQVYGKEWTFLGHPFTFSGIYCTPATSSTKCSSDKTSARITSHLSADTNYCSTQDIHTNANRQTSIQSKRDPNANPLNSPSAQLQQQSNQQSQQQTFGLNLAEAISFGQTGFLADDVNAIVMSMGLDQFRGCDYNLVHHNCNDFSAYLLRILIPGANLPGWVNRLARITRPFSFVDRLICDKARRGYFILEMLYVAFLGDTEAVRMCVGDDERFKIKHLQAAVEDGVNHGRIPKALPFYPMLNAVAYRKAHNFLNLSPVATSALNMQRSISINALIDHAETFYENAWKVFEEINRRNERFIKRLQCPSSIVVNV